MNSKTPRKPARLFAQFLMLLGSVWLSGHAIVAFTQVPQKHVLLVYENRSDMQGNVVVDQTIRAFLRKEFDVSVDIHSEYFEIPAAFEKDHDVLVNWLRHKYAGITFDVVVPVGSSALPFVSAYQRELFPNAQVVFWGREDAIQNWKSDSPLTGVLAPTMVRQMNAEVGFILRLQPDLRNMVVISGAAEPDRQWEAVARRELRSFEQRLSITYLAAPVLEDLHEYVQNLPPHTAIIFTAMNEDGAGKRLVKSEVLTKVAQIASAPVYSFSNIHLDTGIVGGVLLSQESLANETAAVVARLLRGERAQDIPVRAGSLTPTVMWRQLHRWGIAESLLPPRTVVVNRDPSIWVTYRRRIITILSVFTLQTILIVALLVERASRRRAESSLKASRRLLQSAIDALPSPIALLDGKGKVVAVNESWSGFAEPSPFIGSDKRVGCDYLEICKSVPDSEDTRLVCDAVRDVISGQRDQFWGVYHCGRGTEKLHFQVRINRFHTDLTPWVVMAHENVTEIKQAHDAQKQLTALLLRAQDDERRRIARDLHDVTVQNVVAIKGHLNRIQKVSQQVDGNIEEKLKESLRLTDQVIHELRTVSYLLHPPLLDELGLIPALQWFIRGFNERSEIRLNLVIKGEIARLPSDVETALFRVTQESIANIHRHSGSSDGTVTVTYEQNIVIVQIADHGRGFAGRWRDRVDATFAPGVGIMGMQQRLEQLGGHLDIDSSRQGTTVTARIVVRKEGYATNFDRRRPRRSAPVHS
jgi:signal transduction histidine kinase/ABC-type uncharacterized transport system substrate-binding protein